MGQTSNSKGFAQLGRKLNLGAAKHQGRKQTTAVRTRHLLKPGSNRPTCISNRSPRLTQHLPLIRPELTPTAEPMETLCGPRYQRMNARLRCLQRTLESQLPTLLGRVWARSKDDLGSTSGAPTIDAFHIDQGRAAGFKDAGIGLQPTNQLNRATNQTGWIMGAW